MPIKVLVLYYSVHGHITALAEAIAEGVRLVPDAEVEVLRVPEIPSAAAPKHEATGEKYATIAGVTDLLRFDAFIIGAPTRYGSMAGPMRHFLDQTGELWSQGALEGKVGSAFTSTATQHGGQELTLMNIITNLMHFGMVIVGLPYSAKEQMTLFEVVGGSPYGVTTITGGHGERKPSRNELKLAQHQGKHVAEIAMKLRA